MKLFFLFFLVCSFLLSCTKESDSPAGQEPRVILNKTKKSLSPVQLIGERLFRESRFAQHYFAHSKIDLNQMPEVGDPALENLETLTAKIVNPFRGQSMSCAACHLSDQLASNQDASPRVFNSFAQLDPIPDRGDQKLKTLRNTPTVLGTSKANTLLHYDGQFATAEELVKESFLGRNFGWLAQEKNMALAHMAQVIRQDNGQFPGMTKLQNYSYKQLFEADKNLPDNLKIPNEYRVQISALNDEQIVQRLSFFVAEYLRVLDFSRDENGDYDGSPYDLFLRKNNLPLRPNEGESVSDYSFRLSVLVAQLKKPIFVSEEDGQFKSHQQKFVFGPDEFMGLKVFSGWGRCIRCHTAPDYTDHLFHNVGVSQIEYDQIHGKGKFMDLPIPALKEKMENPDLYLLPSEKHPFAQGLLQSRATAKNPSLADLGVWNNFAHPDLTPLQPSLRQKICLSQNLACDALSDAEVLEKSIGLFKTPTLRNLSFSGPYMHNGQFANLAEVSRLYILTTELSKQGKLRNADPQIRNIEINEPQIKVLTKFLQSLNED